MELTSPDFVTGGPIPKRFTCDDVNHSPGLRISGVPKAAKSLVLIMDDPDAPGGTFNHWLIWGLSPDLKEIVTNSVPNGAVQGLNDFKKNGYGGPCPPSGEHRYYFRLYAADIPVNSSASGSSGGPRQSASRPYLERRRAHGEVCASQQPQGLRHWRFLICDLRFAGPALGVNRQIVNHQITSHAFFRHCLRSCRSGDRQRD